VKSRTCHCIISKYPADDFLRLSVVFEGSASKPGHFVVHDGRPEVETAFAAFLRYHDLGHQKGTFSDLMVDACGGKSCGLVRTVVQ